MSFEDQLYRLLQLYDQSPAWVKSTVAWGYRCIPDSYKYGKGYQTYVNDVHWALSASDKEMEEFQLQKLRQSLLAAAAAPYYGKKFKELGLNPSALSSLDELQKYPLLTKDILAKHREDLVNPEYGAKHRLFTSTGGSSGTPVGFYLHRGVSRPKEKAYLDAIWAQVGWNEQLRGAILRGMNFEGRFSGSIARIDPIRNALLLSSSGLEPSTMEGYLREINQFRPDYINAYPSSLLYFTKWMDAHSKRLSFQIKFILCGSEMLTPEDQTYLESFYGVKVMHWYGHSERAVLAYQKGDSKRLYFIPTYGYIELGPKNEGGYHEVIATSFDNDVMPLIRYRTGDLVKLPEERLQEANGLEIEKVMGRAHEWLVSKTLRRVSLTAFNRHDHIFDVVYAIQFAQREPGKVKLLYQPLGKISNHQLERLKRAVVDKLGEGFEIEFVEVDRVEKSKFGKSRWVIESIVN